MPAGEKAKPYVCFSKKNAFGQKVAALQNLGAPYYVFLEKTPSAKKVAAHQNRGTASRTNPSASWCDTPIRNKHVCQRKISPPTHSSIPIR